MLVWIAPSPERGGGREGRGLDLLRAVLDGESSGHACAGGGRVTAGGLDAVDLLEVAGGAGAGEELEPGDGGLVQLTAGRVGGGSDGVVLGAGDLAELHGGGVEVEEGRSGVGEEVLARDGQVDGPDARRLVVGQVELQGDLGEHVQEIGVGGGDAGGVEEGRDGADGHGDGGGVLSVARVVLDAPSDGDVLKAQTGARRGETRDCRRNVSLCPGRKREAGESGKGDIRVGTAALLRSQTATSDISLLCCTLSANMLK